MPWIRGNENDLKPLKISRRGLDPQIHPLFRVKFSFNHPESVFCCDYRFFQGDLFSDWNEPQNSIRDGMIKIVPNHLFCQALGGAGTRFSFSSPEQYIIDVLYDSDHPDLCVIIDPIEAVFVDSYIII